MAVRLLKVSNKPWLMSSLGLLTTNGIRGIGGAGDAGSGTLRSLNP